MSRSLLLLGKCCLRTHSDIQQQANKDSGSVTEFNKLFVSHFHHIQATLPWDELNSIQPEGG